MSDLTYFHKQTLENILGMSGGYVLDFSNRTFYEFFADALDIKQYDFLFDASCSKAKRLREFWSLADNQDVIIFLNAICKHKLKEQTKINSIKNITDELTQKNIKIVKKEKIDKLSHQFINEQIEKAESKLNNSDYDGAITNARSLVEAIQEEIILQSGETIPEYDGNLQKLYKETKRILNLTPDNKDLSDTLKQVLTGLNTTLVGISGLSNKMADRHSRQYKPAKHHAKLAINIAFTFCEFLLDSFEYQKK